MKETIESHELFVLNDFGGIVRGTYHKTYHESSGPQSSLTEKDPIGVVFLNRSGHGDAVVCWADSFAEHGYPSFRLDLPGFGDSEGDTPTEWLEFINSGGYASIISAKIGELTARFNLSGVVIVGHCAGAVSALYTAVASRECRGLVLMDPYFDLPRTVSRKIRRQLSDWALQSRFGRPLSDIYDLLKKIGLSLRGNMPPKNANLPLIRCWKKLASTGLPMLILKAPGRKNSSTKPRVGEFDYLKYVLELVDGRSQIVVKVAAGANHFFANRPGRAAVLDHTECWLNAYFPLTPCGSSAASMLHRAPGSRKNDYKNREQCLKA